MTALSVNQQPNMLDPSLATWFDNRLDSPSVLGSILDVTIYLNESYCFMKGMVERSNVLFLAAQDFSLCFVTSSTPRTRYI